MEVFFAQAARINIVVDICHVLSCYFPKLLQTNYVCIEQSKN